MKKVFLFIFFSTVASANILWLNTPTKKRESEVKMTIDGPVRAFRNVASQPSLKKAPAPNPTPKPAPATAPKDKAKPKDILWDNWYTVKKNGLTPWAYFNEKAEFKGDKVFLNVNMWRREDGFINQEHEGAAALNNDQLTPLFYNYFKNDKGTEIRIDGTIEGGRILKAKVRVGKKTAPMITKELPEKSILYSFFPIWIHKKLPVILKRKKPGGFITIQEENYAGRFPVEMGSIVLLKPDKFAGQTQTHRLQVRYQSFSSIWWVTERGDAVRIVMPRGNIIIDNVPKKTAQTFFR